MNESNIHNEALAEKYVELMDWDLSFEQKANMFGVLKKMLERGGKIAKFNATVDAFGSRRVYRLFVPSGMRLADAQEQVRATREEVVRCSGYASETAMGRQIQMDLFGAS